MDCVVLEELPVPRTVNVKAALRVRITRDSPARRDILSIVETVIVVQMDHHVQQAVSAKLILLCLGINAHLRIP